MRPANPTPVLPRGAQWILDTAEPRGDCLISLLTPSKVRPLVWLPGDQQTFAYRVVAAVELNRPIEADEDVHHLCETRRCVEPTHLVVQLNAEHQELHAVEQRQATCSVHGVPYAFRNERGWGVCRACAREGTARYRARKRGLSL